MKQRIIVLGLKEETGKNDAQVIAHELAARFNGTVVVSFVAWQDLIFSIAKNKIMVSDNEGNDLARADHILAYGWYSKKIPLIRDIAFATALYLESQGVRYWNSEMGQQRSTTKLSAMMQLALGGIDVPDTLFSLNAHSITRLQQDFPCIVKRAAASRGTQNYLVSNKNELQRTVIGTHNLFLVQEYIPNTHDLRVIMAGEQPELFIRRSRSDDTTHLNNTSKGAIATVITGSDLPMEIRNIACRVAAIFGRQMGGVDIVVAEDGSGRYPVLEVNAIPQLTSGTFMQEKYDGLASGLRKILKETPERKI